MLTISYTKKKKGLHQYVPHVDPVQHLLQFESFVLGKRKKRVGHLIWLATSRALWGVRNKIIFIFKRKVLDIVFYLMVCTSFMALI